MSYIEVSKYSSLALKVLLFLSILSLLLFASFSVIHVSSISFPDTPIESDSIDSGSPTILFSSTSKSINFNSSVRSYYYLISSSEYQSYSLFGFYVNRSETLDTLIMVHADTFTSDPLEVGDALDTNGSEFVVFQPYSIPGLVGQDFLVNITAKSGDGSTEFIYKEYESNDYVGESTDLDNIAEVDIESFNMAPLRYTRGADLKISIENYNYPEDTEYSYDLHIYNENGDLNDALFTYTNITFQNGSIYQDVVYIPDFDLNVGTVTNGTSQGLVMVIVGHRFASEQYMRVETNVSIPKINNEVPNKLPSQGYTEANLTGGTDNYFVLKTPFGVSSIFMDTDSFDFNYSIDISNNSILQAPVSFSDNNRSLYTINNFGQTLDDVPQNYSPDYFYYYFIRINIQYNTTVQFLSNSTDLPTTVASNQSGSFSLDDSEMIIKILRMDSFPTTSVLWSSVQEEQQILMTLSNGTSDFNNLRSAISNSHSIASLGSIDNSYQDYFFLTYVGLTSNGEVDYTYYRGTDNTAPTFENVTISPSSPSYLDNLNFEYDISDNLAIQNVTVNYGQGGSNLNYTSEIEDIGQLSYGDWLFSFTVYDTAGNSITDNNNGENYLISISDNIVPHFQISFDTYYFVGINETIEFMVDDPGSGISDMSIYELSNNSVIEIPLSQNPNGIYHFNLEPTYIGLLNLSFYITDGAGNTINNNYTIEVLPAEITLSLLNTTINTTVDDVSNIVLEVNSAELIDQLTLHYSNIQTGENGTIDTFSISGTTVMFSLVFVESGIYNIWFEVMTIVGDTQVFGNITIEVVDVDGINSTNTTSTSNNLSSTQSTIPSNGEDSGNIGAIVIVSSIVIGGFGIALANQIGALEGVKKRLRERFSEQPQEQSPEEIGEEADE